MAIFKPGIGIDGISGKIGGQSLSKQTQYNTIRNISQPAKAPTPKQSTQRFTTAVISNLWTSLTAGQKTAWNAAAIDYFYLNPFGVPVQRTGFNTFRYLAQNLNILELPPLLDPPTYIPIIEPTITIDSSTTNELIISGTDIESDYIYPLFVQINLPGGVLGFGRQTRHVGNLTPAQLTAGVNILPMLETYFGIPLRTAYISFAVDTVNSSTGNRAAEKTYINTTLEEPFQFALSWHIDTTKPTPNGNLIFEIPTDGTLTYNYSVYTNEHEFHGVTGNITLNFEAPYIGPVHIEGTFPRPRFSLAVDRDKLIRIDKMANPSQITDQSFAYRGCRWLESVNDPTNFMNTLVNGTRMFESCTRLVTLSSNITFDELVTGIRMFFGPKLTTINPGTTFNKLTNGDHFLIQNPIASLPEGVTFENLTVGHRLLRQTLIEYMPTTTNFNKLTDGRQMFLSGSLKATPLNNSFANLTNGTAMFANTPLDTIDPNFEAPKLSLARTMFQNTLITDLPTIFKLNAITNGVEMFLNVTLNTPRYSQVLVDLEFLNPNNGVGFHGGNSKYNTTGETARNILTAAPRSWIITDGGLE